MQVAAHMVKFAAVCSLWFTSAQGLDVDRFADWSFDEIALTRNFHGLGPFPCQEVEAIRLRIRKWRMGAHREELDTLGRQACVQASNKS